MTTELAQLRLDTKDLLTSIGRCAEELTATVEEWHSDAEVYATLVPGETESIYLNAARLFVAVATAHQAVNACTSQLLSEVQCVPLALAQKRFEANHGTRS